MGDDGHKISDWVKARRERIQEARTAGVGEVGIFWLLPSGKLLISSMPWSEAETYASHFRIWGEHYGFWEQLKPHAPELRNLEYEQTPRGRVSYDTVKDRFVVYGSHSLLADESLLTEVAKEFQLDGKGVELMQDDHYEIR